MGLGKGEVQRFTGGKSGYAALTPGYNRAIRLQRIGDIVLRLLSSRW